MNEEEEYNHLADLTTENDDLRSKLYALRAELAKAENAEREANYELDKSRQALKEEKDNLRALQAQIARLEKENDHERAATKDAEGRVEVLYTDLDQSRFAHRSALADRDEALADKRDAELQLDDLRQQWQECEDKIAELEAELDEAQKAADQVLDLERDIARLREEMADLDRSIIVKDERISHLELHLQKERQRSYHAADAIAREKAASPVDEDQHVGAVAFESLEAELSMIEDNESYYEVEPNDFSHITETLLTWSPIAPAAQPPSTLHTLQAVSVSPVAPHVPRLTLDVREAAHLEPREPAPVALSTSLNEGASTAPVAVVVPTHTLTMRETASTEPIEPSRSLSSIHQHQAASTAPIEPARTPRSSIHAHEAASTAPKAPSPTLQTTFEVEIADIAPREPGLPALTVSVREAASTTPIVRRISTTDLSTQTDFASLTSQLIDHATVSIAPTTPIEVATAEFSTQTEAPVLASQLVTYATVSTTPVAPTETITTEHSVQTDANSVPSEISATCGIAITPIEPKHGFRRVTTKGTQTVPESPTSIRVGSVLVTHQMEPVEQVLPKAEPKRPTASTGVQTIVETPVVKEEAKPKPAPQPAPVPRASKSKSGITDLMVRLSAVLMAFTCFHLYTQLQAWKKANGIGMGGGYGNMASRSGAYGNGRYLFGIFPMGMNVGDSWLTEQIARHASSAVARFEDWAGIAYEPLY
ncbi:hypothetical protein ACJQWK_07305 [Exserohilum turcicum]|uniref:Uncharacterized protein n=1 Tax=Exserohilum turcicum (strain 28A) TaxID=671987 RepID=R0IH70_EXST2|nr:uncharacterized protein SETTUDRAFT_41845 [Exserohilum turcica Et28A]EOA84540.1 hypothetical protein SETTUDRAFT_41845 [Exserohilum turcica Et28A]